MLLDDVASLLESLAHGNVKTTGTPATGWWIYKGSMTPSNRDPVITLAEYAGGPPLEEFGAAPGVVAEVAGLQVQARNEQYDTARAKAEAVWGALHRFSGTLGSTRYLGIECRSSPFPVGRDGDGRWIIGFNCLVWKERG